MPVRFNPFVASLQTMSALEPRFFWPRIMPARLLGLLSTSMRVLTCRDGKHLIVTTISVRVENVRSIVKPSQLSLRILGELRAVGGIEVHD